MAVERISLIKNFEEISNQLRELADVINQFKSEAVQLRLVELIFNAAEETADEENETSGGEAETPAVPRRRRRKKTGGSSKSPAVETAKTRAGTGRPGGKATLAKLLSEGFFRKPKTIKQLVEHCDHNLALKYKQSDFSGGLARYVRDGKLKRTKNTDKQYEYSQN